VNFVGSLSLGSKLETFTFALDFSDGLALPVPYFKEIFPWAEASF